MTLAELGHTDTAISKGGPTCGVDFCKRCGECLQHALEQQAPCTAPANAEGPHH